MGKYGLWVVLILTMAFSAVIVRMNNELDKFNVTIINVAKNSYSIGCMDSFDIMVMPKDKSILVCNQLSILYIKPLVNIIGENH